VVGETGFEQAMLYLGKLTFPGHRCRLSGRKASVLIPSEETFPP
jgi:hypothetical protein